MPISLLRNDSYMGDWVASAEVGATWERGRELSSRMWILFNDSKRKTN